MNARRVPLPSSRETTVMFLVESKLAVFWVGLLLVAHAEISVSTAIRASIGVTSFFIFFLQFFIKIVRSAALEPIVMEGSKKKPQPNVRDV